jgi:CNT family concentrative nucleoside transporter
LSAGRKNINWRVVAWGAALQAAFGLFIFVFPAGARAFLLINDIIVTVLEAASKGAEFVFGPLALGPGREGSMGFILAFQAFPTIIFFSALMSVLYFLGIMPALIRAFAGTFTRLMKISGAESLCAASNIFVGIESALTIRPHLAEMTRSELCTVLTAGLATVASNVMALYVFMLRAQFPTIAGHLVSASILSAPAAIVMSKMLLPETQTPRTLGRNIRPHYEKEDNIFEAVINGAQGGLKLIAGIVALLIAVLGLVALVDLALGGLGGKFNGCFGVTVDWSLKGLLGYVFYPFALVLGVPLSDAPVVARLIGERLIVTEVTAYQDLAAAMAGNALAHGRSAVIAAYALCGFTHVASLAIFIGGISALAPSRTRALSRVGFRALLAATLACMMTACIAGAFYKEGSVLFGG